jgi:hypothetical protein
MAKITVHREGYKRRGYTREDGTRVAATYVPPATFKIEDRGAPGRGERVFEIKHPGEMTAIAKKMGYEHVTDVPDRRLGELAERLHDEYGERSARGMIQAQINFRMRTRGPAWEKFRKLKEAFERRYKGRDR